MLRWCVDVFIEVDVMVVLVFIIAFFRFEPKWELGAHERVRNVCCEIIANSIPACIPVVFQVSWVSGSGLGGGYSKCSLGDR